MGRGHGKFLQGTPGRTIIYIKGRGDGRGVRKMSVMEVTKERLLRIWK